MPVIEITTDIAAPIERCFLLSLDIDVHQRSTSSTDERAVAGVTSGLIGMCEEVTWEAKHFGVRQRLTSRITAYDFPRHFRDTMLRGAFKRFDHDHYFSEHAGVTTVRDRFEYRAPLGPLGWIAERLFLTRYMRRFLEVRNRHIKELAESDGWREFLTDDEIARIASVYRSDSNRS